MNPTNIAPLAEPDVDLLPVRRALLSVSDKSHLVPFAQALDSHGVRLISTGGTAAALTEAGLNVTAVERITGFPEIMDGRVKTLHPKVHGGLLARPDLPEHRDAMDRLGIEPISLLCVNLYPFSQTVARPGITPAEAIENIDVGGPCMVRSAAKNYAFVAVVTDPSQYEQVLAELAESGGMLSLATRRRLAAAAFDLTARYDAAISAYFRDRLVPGRGEGAELEACPGTLALTLERVAPLRYGENPHQAAALYRNPAAGRGGAADARLIGGKEISYNNYVDADAAVELVREFVEPAAVVVKHTNPAGAAVHPDIVEAYRRAYLGDANAAMGGILAFNRPVTVELADALMNSYARWGKAAGAGGFFAEVVAAPSFDEPALQVIRSAKTWGQNVRLLATGPLAPSDDRGLALKTLVGGVLAMQRDYLGLNEEQWTVVSRRRPTPRELDDLRFAWLCCKHVKSNAIVLARDRTLLGAGAGQMSRVTSSRLAAELARASAVSRDLPAPPGEPVPNSVGTRSSEPAGPPARRPDSPLAGCVLASDAFFPFRDGVDAAASAGAVAMIQPGGSKKDDEVIAAADEHSIAMIFTATRHFRH